MLGNGRSAIQSTHCINKAISCFRNDVHHFSEEILNGFDRTNGNNYVPHSV
jgi:hypothetical protein